MKHTYIWILLCCILLSNQKSFAYKPTAHTYVSKDYKGHQVSYDAIFDDNGLLYVANAYGVLEFDGYYLDYHQIKL